MAHVTVYSTIASGVGSKEFKFRVSPARRHHYVTTQAATNITWASTLTHVGHPRVTLRSSSQPRWALQVFRNCQLHASFPSPVLPPGLPCSLKLFSEATQPVLYPIPHIAWRSLTGPSERRAHTPAVSHAPSPLRSGNATANGSGENNHVRAHACCNGFPGFGRRIISLSPPYIDTDISQHLTCQYKKESKD